MPNIDIPDADQGNPLGYALSTLAPNIGNAAGDYVRAVYQTLNLPLRVAEAARYRTALINGCLVCQSFRAGDHLDGYLESVGGDPASSLVARGGARPDEAFYAAIHDWRNAGCFSDQEILAIAYAEHIAERPDATGYDEAFWSDMRKAFSDSEIVELTLAIGCWLAMGRLTHVLGLDTQCVTDALNAAE